MNLQELKKKNPAELISEAEKLGIEIVSTKYLQQYLNWHKIKESIKFRNDTLNAFIEKTINIGALKHFDQIEHNYRKLLTTL